MSLFELATKVKGTFDHQMVGRRAQAAFGEPLSKIAAFVWRRSTHSIRKPRRMRREELSPARLQVFESRLEDARTNGLPVPVLPYASSKPGEPPRTPTGILPTTIQFAVDGDRGSAVIGPVARRSHGQTVPSVLEFGGEAEIHGTKVHVEPRPFMAPALEAEVSKMPQLFEGIF